MKSDRLSRRFHLFISSLPTIQQVACGGAVATVSSFREKRSDVCGASPY
jgi:hypothetical protein